VGRIYDAAAEASVDALLDPSILSAGMSPGMPFSPAEPGGRVSAPRPGALKRAREALDGALEQARFGAF
jgi:hypothetical protein